MKKSYLFVYSNDLGSRDEVKQLLEEMPEIIDWRYDIPNTFYLISEESAQTIAELIIKKRKSEARFVIVDFDSGKHWGWLTNESWHLIENKQRKKE